MHSDNCILDLLVMLHNLAMDSIVNSILKSIISGHISVALLLLSQHWRGLCSLCMFRTTHAFSSLLGISCSASGFLGQGTQTMPKTWVLPSHPTVSIVAKAGAGTWCLGGSLGMAPSGTMPQHQWMWVNHLAGPGLSWALELPNTQQHLVPLQR